MRSMNRRLQGAVLGVLLVLLVLAAIAGVAALFSFVEEIFGRHGVWLVGFSALTLFGAAYGAVALAPTLETDLAEDR